MFFFYDYLLFLVTKIFGKKEENVSYCRLLSLLDPVTRKRMEIPCRGINCTHIDCFDKNGFFRYNRRRLEWKCPICQKPIKDDQLVVDGFFVNVLAKVFSSCKFIQIASLNHDERSSGQYQLITFIYDTRSIWKHIFYHWT